MEGFRYVSLLWTTHKILSNILLSWLTPHTDEPTGDHQCGFQHYGPIADQMFCIQYIIELIWA